MTSEKCIHGTSIQHLGDDVSLQTPTHSNRSSHTLTKDQHNV